MREKLAAENGAENTDGLTAETVVERVRNGDAAARAIWDETIKYLAIGLGNAVTLIAPEVVVIGGGVAEAGELLLAPLRSAIAQNVSMVPIDKVEILRASLGSDSGVCGALMLAQRGLKEREEHVY